MAGTTTEHGGRRPRPATPKREVKSQVLEAGAIIAVGAAAVAFVVGVGTYLYIRFTQDRKKPPG